MNQRPTYAKPGELYYLELPHSEVCMHMGIAGQNHLVMLLTERNAAQIYTIAMSPISSPVLPSEAGFFEDDHGFYCYPVSGFHAGR